MRTITAMGLLAAALIPISFDNFSIIRTEAPTLLANGPDIHTPIVAQLFVARQNVAIQNSMERSARFIRQEFVAQRNHEIEASTAAVTARQTALLADARNSEINLSTARVTRVRLVAFTSERNAEVRRSLVAYAGARDALFAEARNREIATSAANVATLRTATFIAERNTEIGRSMRVAAIARDRQFAIARNAEIDSASELQLASSLPRATWRSPHRSRSRMPNASSFSPMPATRRTTPAIRWYRASARSPSRRPAIARSKSRWCARPTRCRRSRWPAGIPS
jgi:hypothetical protein